MGEETGRFRRSDRLLDSRDFRRVLRRGRRHAHREIVVITTQKSIKSNKYRVLKDLDQPGSRLGITAGRKVGNAVVRNRFKRRLRAWFRLRRRDFPGELDIVVIARRPGVSLSLEQLDSRLSKLLGILPVPRLTDSDTI